MKCKITRGEGQIKLITKNEKEEEILLASAHHYFHSQSWILKDVRYRSDFWHPSSHIPESNDFLSYSCEEERDFICSQLFDYNINEEKKIISWMTFEYFRLDGDLPFEKRYYKDSVIACWSYRRALKEISLAKPFWENFKGDIKEARIENPHIQKRAFHLNKYISFD